MFLWLTENWGTLLVALALCLIVALALRSTIRNRKRGSAPCGGSCASCGGCKYHP